jgi:hypothetical protein
MRGLVNGRCERRIISWKCKEILSLETASFAMGPGRVMISNPSLEIYSHWCVRKGLLARHWECHLMRI